MTTLIQYQDRHTHLLGLDGLVDMLGPCVVSVERTGEAKDHFVSSVESVYAVADKIIRERLNASILDARFTETETGSFRTLILYREPGLTASIVYDPDGGATPYRVMQSRTATVFEAPKYGTLAQAQMAFDAIVRPRLDGRYAVQTIGPVLLPVDTSNTASNNIGDRP